MKAVWIFLAWCAGFASLAFGQANVPVAVPGAPTSVAVKPVAVLAPVKTFVKIDEPVAIRFLEQAPGKDDAAQQALDAAGIPAAKIPGLFRPAAAADFTLFTFGGAALPPAKTADAKNGVVDIGTLYPDIYKGGTFVLAWKNATPLVIETLRNPLPWEMLLDPRVQPAERTAVVQQFRNQPASVIHIVPLEYALIKTEKGTLKAKFYYDAAPHTIDSWVSLARGGLYDNGAFHRIIKNFMVQGGDPLGSTERAGTGGPGYQINAEFNNKPHVRGVLSMARSQSANSAGSQFFLMHGKGDFLDGKYTAFGEVFEGAEVIDKLAQTPVSDDNGTVKGPKPKLESVQILPATAEMYGMKK